MCTRTNRRQCFHRPERPVKLMESLDRFVEKTHIAGKHAAVSEIPEPVPLRAEPDFVRVTAG